VTTTGPAVLRALLPSAAALAEGWIGGSDQEAGLLRAEEALVARAVAKRRREFATGRMYARAALASLGAPSVAILVGRRREPLWPQGVVGSITHTDRYCAAAVAWERDLAALGIDAELDTPLDEQLRRLVCDDAEHAWCGHHGDAGERGKLLFSIKESVFKALYPLTGVDLGFHAVRVEADLVAGRFRIRPASANVGLLATLLPAVQGAFGQDQGHVFTVAWLPPGRGRQDNLRP
jgi:4'-phosphopantetheinyl transferase EntD